MIPIENKELLEICRSLCTSSLKIYKSLKSGFGLSLSKTVNESNDIQLDLDVFADDCFQEELKENPYVKYCISEEQPSLVQVNNGKYSVALDPLDGSKSAMVGIPCGAIFGIFKEANKIEDFNGSNVVAGGFFVFGINLEVFFSAENKVFKGTCNVETETWLFEEIKQLPKAKMVAMNASNINKWEPWLAEYYNELISKEDENGKSYNMRWYASMVSELKRLVLQGGLFSYPNDSRKGYDNGHLRLVYEAIPMAYLMRAIGGSSSNGKQCILKAEVKELHQKTPVFLGDKEMIEEIEKRGKGKRS